ncbi:hypothetical protein LWM68_40970 [Niabella sp. W65]|nr:hypothetical protein [Niabella sp. W65]MCH7368546.1 hypothetical protein [Niabella sp. W65]ULT44135.1 hypothetical protein KRR40_12665 [Niabella sp. I65]
MDAPKGDAKSATDALKKAEEELRGIIDSSNQTTAQQVGNLKRLADNAANTALSTNQRKAAIKQLQDLYPSYFKNLTLETAQTAMLSQQVSLLTANLMAAGRARILSGQADKHIQRAFEFEQKRVPVAQQLVKANKELAALEQRFSKDGTFDVTKLSEVDYYVYATQLGKVKELRKSFASFSLQMDDANNKAEKLNYSVGLLQPSMGNIGLDGSDITKQFDKLKKGTDDAKAFKEAQKI